MFKNILLSFFLIPLIGNAQSQVFKKCYGGSSTDIPFKAKQTLNKNIAFVGYSQSTSGDIEHNYGAEDFWLIITDTNGTIKTKKNYGSSGTDIAYSLTQCRDSGFAIVGISNKADSNVSHIRGQADVWLIKTDPSGNLLWEKSYGGSSSEHAYCISQTPDNGFLLAGLTHSSDSDITLNRGSSDAWLIKTDSSGNIKWQKTYGGPGSEGFNSLFLCANGDLLVCGLSSSSSGDLTSNNGSEDLWIMRLSNTGTILWSKSFGGNISESGQSVIETSSGDIIVAGTANSNNNGDVTGNHGLSDCWVIKLNASGSLKWKKCFGGTLLDYANDIIETDDNKYIFCGATRSTNGNLLGNSIYGSEDYWIAKTDTSGMVVWQKNYGGTQAENAACAVSLGNDHYGFLGASLSNSHDVTNNNGLNDAWLLILKDQSNATGIQPSETNDKLQYSLYPNPASTTVYVNFKFGPSTAKTATLYNSLGEKTICAYFENANEVESIDISNISSGMYFLEVRDAVSTRTSKIIISK